MSAVIDQTNETPEHAARRLANKPIQNGFKPEALHTYTGPEGSPLFWRIRLKHPDGEKWIRPMHWNGATFVLGEPEFPTGKPLYLLHELHNRPNETVVIVEGEKCADALARLGVLSTTSGSADSAETAYWAPLSGRDVLLWPDSDVHGQKYADTVTRILSGLDCTVRRIDVAALSTEGGAK